MPMLIAILTGAASAFAFQPFALWPLMPLAFAVLCQLIARAPSLRRALAIGWGFGVGQFLVGLNWIATAFTFQAAMPAWLGWIAVVLVSLYLAIYPMIAAGLAWRLGAGKRLPLVLALAGSWAITEWLRAGIFTGFAWNPVAVALVDTPLLRTTAIIGTYGLSAVVALAGGALWLAYRKEWSAASALAAPLLIAGLVSWAWPGIEPRREARRIRIVQPNIEQDDKWREGFGDKAIGLLQRLSLPVSREPLLLFWPEAAVTAPIEDGRAHPIYQADAAGERERAAATLGAGDLLVTGGIALTASDRLVVDGATNSVFALALGGRTIGRYDKAHLVPYGEYLPMRPLLSAIGLSRLAPGELDFAPGPGPRTVALPGFGRMGLQLCYEIIFSGEVVDRANRPDYIFNPSNDAWFGRWGPPQHLAQARLRAAEEGLPVIRATPTGISALIDADGRVLHSLAWRTAGRIDSTLPPARAATLFARLGNILPLLFAAGLLILAIALARGRRYRRI